MSSPRWGLRWFLLTLTLAAMGWHSAIADSRGTVPGKETLSSRNRVNNARTASVRPTRRRGRSTAPSPPKSS